VHHIAILDLSPCFHFPQNLCAISSFPQREVHPAQTSQIAHYPCLDCCLVIFVVSIWLSCRQHRGVSVLFHLCQRNNYHPLTITPAFIRRLDIINRGFRYPRPSLPLVPSHTSLTSLPSGYNTSQVLRLLPSFMPKPSQAHIRFIVFLSPFPPQSHLLPPPATPQPPH